MLLTITSQVIQTQTKASGNLETNQVAQFVLDRIQEDLQCAVFKNDGNVWMAADILTNTDNSGRWNEKSYSVPKPSIESLRVSKNIGLKRTLLQPIRQINKDNLLNQDLVQQAPGFRFFPKVLNSTPKQKIQGR